jgi:GT2 family glycosyltransferase
MLLALHCTAHSNVAEPFKFKPRPDMAKSFNIAKSRIDGAASTAPYEFLIPVIGIPLAGDSRLLFLRLMYSIDVPVKHIIIVASPGTFTSAQYRHLDFMNFNTCVITSARHVGVSEAWNIIVALSYRQPWILIIACDTYLLRGSLNTLIHHMKNETREGKAKAHYITYANINQENNYALWNCFAFEMRLFLELGLFDENIFPAYYEDTDYNLRMGASGIESDVLKNVIGVHGDKNIQGYITGVRDFKSSMMRTVKVGHCLNGLYFKTKWGCSSDGTCRFKRPFNASVSITYWKFNHAWRRIHFPGVHLPLCRETCQNMVPRFVRECLTCACGRNWSQPDSY